MKKGLLWTFFILLFFALEVFYLSRRIETVLNRLEQEQSALRTEIEQVDADCFRLYRKQVDIRLHHRRPFDPPLLAVDANESAPLLAAGE